MRKLLLLLAISLCLVGVDAYAQPDTDGDGVLDGADLCPAEDASFFDADGDGCVDAFANARHIEFWRPENLPLSFWIHQNGAPGIADGSDFAAIQLGFDTWTSVPGAQISVSYLGTTAQSDADGLDGINLVTFEDPEFLVLYGNAVLAVGITTSFTEPTNFDGTDVLPGEIVDADMLFNPNRQYSTDTAGVGPDLRGVAAHESGHLLGLNHSSIPNATMFPALPAGLDARSLELDDEILAFMAYPETSAAANATVLEGSVNEGAPGNPLPGALIFVSAAPGGEILASQYTLPDGSFRVAGLPPGDVYVYTHPLDGSAGSNGVIPGYINDLVESTAVTVFLPEYWDDAENGDDDSDVRSPITLSAGTTTSGIDIITNVDLLAPTIADTAPIAGSTGVRNDSVILLEFDERLDFDSLAGRFHLNRTDIPQGVAGSLTLLSGEQLLAFSPSGPLAYDASYRVTLDAGIADLFGNAIGTETTVDFSTESAPPLSLRSVSPTLMTAGVVALIDGEGFDTATAANNMIHLGAISVPATSASNTRLQFIVPANVPLEDFELSVSTTTETSNTLNASGFVSVEIARGSPNGEVALSGIPRSIEVLPDVSFAYVATSAGLGVVSVAPSSFEFGSLTEYALGELDDLAVAPDGSRVYAISGTDSTIQVVNSRYGSDLNAPLPDFNNVLFTLATGSRPNGIAVSPDGQLAFVAVEEGIIQIWDILLSSGTYNRRIGEIRVEGTSWEGGLAVDPSGTRLLSISDQGDVYVHSTSDGSLLGSAFTGPDPQDIAVDPQGNLAYISDGSGNTSVFSLSSLNVTQTIDHSGSLRGIGLTPGGGLGYLANRANDTLDAIELRGGELAFRTVVSELPIADDPVDVAMAPDGLQVYSISEGTQTFNITGIGFGPELFSITPRFAKAGDLVAIYGSGFHAVDSTLTVITSSTGLDFGGINVTPISASGGYMFARVPEGYDGGPIRAANQGAVFVGIPDVRYSNPLFLKEPVPLPPAEQDSTTSASVLGQNTGFPWTDTSNGLLISPDGKLLLLQGSVDVEIVDIDFASPTYFQHIGTLFGEVLTVSGNAAFSADGSLLFIGDTGSLVDIYDMERNSPQFGQDIGDVSTNAGGFTLDSNIIRGTPDGRYILLAGGSTPQVFYAYSDPLDGIFGFSAVAMQLNSPAIDMAVHPSGVYVYAITNDGGILHVGSLDPFQPTEFSVVSQQTAVAAGAEFQRMAFSPDGSRCFITTRVGGLGGSYEVDLYDTTAPDNPVHMRSYEISLGSPGETVYISMHPSGDRIYVSIVGQLAQILDVSKSYGPDAATVPDPISFLQNINEGVASVPPAHTFTPDGTRLFIGQWSDTAINMLELRKAGQLEIISGADQQGVAGETLPAPVRVRVSQFGDPVPFSSVEVIARRGGGNLGNGQDYQLITTDSNGNAEVNWTLGPDPDVDGDPSFNELQFFSLPAQDSSSPLQLARAFSSNDPGTLPLALASVVPVDGSPSVSVTTTLQATFSRSVEPLTVDETQVRLLQAGAPVDGIIGFSQQNQKLSFVPISSLDYATDYEFILGTGIQDTDGQSLATPDTTRWTTQAPPPLVVSSLSPPSGPVGTQVVVSGAGFDTDLTQNVVRLGSTVVSVLAGGVDYLRFQVPLGAGTGTVTVEANGMSEGGDLFSVLLPADEPIDEIGATVDLGTSPQALAVTPDGGKAYSVSTETDQVIPVDLSGLSSLSPIAVGDAPVAIVIDPAGSFAYVANYGSGTVSVIDLSTDLVVTTIPVGNNPAELVMAPDGDRVYIVSSVDQEVDVIDSDASSANQHTVVTSVTSGKSTSSMAISPDGTRLFLGTDDGYIWIDLSPTSFGVVTSVTSGKSTSSMAISPDGGLLVLLSNDGDIVIVDIGNPDGDTVVTSVTSGKSTSSMAISPDGGLLYLLQSDSDEIIVYSIEVLGSVSVVENGSFGPTLVNLVLVNSFFAGDDPSFVVFDPSGSGLAFVGNAGDGSLSLLQSTPAPPTEIDLELRLTPRTLNLDSNGNYVSARIEFPSGFAPENVDLSTVRLQDLVPPVDGKTSYEDEDLDGLGELVMKFDRAAFQAVMPQGDRVPAWVTGIVEPNSVVFTARDTIRTLRPTVTHPKGGEFLNPGQQILITWESGDAGAAESVRLDFSADDGMTWMPIIEGITNTEEHPWTVPQLITLEGRILITFFDDAGEDIGMGISPSAFSVESAIPVALQSMQVRAQDGDGVLDWEAVIAPGTRGFHVLRGGSEAGPFQRVTENLVRAENASGTARFSFRDQEVHGNRDYFYLLQEETTQGEGASFGPFHLSYAVGNSLDQNFPNSFNPRTSIRFSIAREGRTRLVVYNVAGRRVKTLVDEVLKPDVYTLQWNGDDDTGSAVSSGIYLYRMETVDFTATKKMSLIR